MSEAPDQQPNMGMPNYTTDAIRRFIHEEVEARVRKENQLIKDSIAVAAKIVGAAMALFLAVFTIFGLTTWSEIKKEAASFVKTQTEELIKQSDSEASVKERLNDLVNRTIVASNLTIRAKYPGQAIDLADNDWDRLRNWLKSEGLSLQDFKDTLAVLGAQEKERRGQDANRVLAEMLNPPEDSPYGWIQRQPEKREAILQIFKDYGLGSTAAELVTSTALTESIRAQAAEYVGEVEYSEGVERLLESYPRLKEGPAKRNALIACLKLRPDHPGVIAAFNTLLAEAPTPHSIQLITSALATVPKLKNSFESESDRKTFRALSKGFVDFLVRNGTYFTLSYFTPEKYYSLSRDLDSAPVTLFPRVQILRMTSEHSASGSHALSIEEFRELETYWLHLADAANAGDISAIVALVPRQYDGSEHVRFLRAEYSVSVKASPGATLNVAERGDSTVLFELASLGDPRLTTIRYGNQPVLQLSWTDASGEERVAKVKEIKGKGYNFSLKRVVKTSSREGA